VSFDVPASIQDEEVTDIVVYLKQDALISVHYPGQFLKNDFRRNMVQPEAGFQINVDIKHQVSFLRYFLGQPTVFVQSFLSNHQNNPN
jgi:hypothetical protein